MTQRSFFNRYGAALQPTFGHYRGDNLTHPILITDGFFEMQPSNSITSL